MGETKYSVRTWFLTLTFRPEEHDGARLRAQVRLASGGTDFDRLGQRDQFEEVVRELTPETQNFIKRVRKNAGFKVRYMLVWEPHKSGNPHAHMLLHEVDGAVSYRLIEQAWTAGFSAAKLVERSNPVAVSYVTKYVSKSAQCRIRASAGYGAVDSWRVDANQLDT